MPLAVPHSGMKIRRMIPERRPISERAEGSVASKAAVARGHAPRRTEPTVGGIAHSVGACPWPTAEAAAMEAATIGESSTPAMRSASAAEAASIETRTSAAMEPTTAAMKTATAVEAASGESSTPPAMKPTTMESTTTSKMKTTAALSEGRIRCESKIRESTDCDEGFNNSTQSPHNL